MLLLALLVATVRALDINEISELRNIRRIFVDLNDGSSAGLATPWLDPIDANSCATLSTSGITCNADLHVVTIRVQDFFQGTTDTEIFDTSQVDFQNFAFLGVLIVVHRQMTGTFDLRLPPSLTSLTINGQQSISETGGYSMKGTFSLDFFIELPLLRTLTIRDLPGLKGPLPSMENQSRLTIFILRNLPALDGPLPDVPFSQDVSAIRIEATSLSGAVPSGYCAAIRPLVVGINPDIEIKDNRFITSLPDCMLTCAQPGPISLCNIQNNAVCDIGQRPFDDQTVFVSLSGALADNCTSLDSSNPCTISRDSSACLDCSGRANGTRTRDFCGVCLEPQDPMRNACFDCQGIPFGTAVYDVCDVCMGDGTSCYDCAGVFAGNAVYDACDVCQGRGDTCDCSGEIGGTRVVDACGVCGGDDACFDCRNVRYGTSELDLCGVCDGDNTSCDDCSGTPAGTKVYDRCGVCNGLNRDCDCRGVRLGFSVFDVCDVCEGDGSSCLDCRGVPNGPAVYDLCDVCGGTDTVGVCDNPRADASLIAAAEEKSTSVLLIIVGVLALLCCVVTAALALTFKRDAEEVAPIAARLDRRNVQFNNNRGLRGGAGGLRLSLVATLVTLAASRVEAVLPETTAFLNAMATHSNVRSVYPEWFSDGGTGPVFQVCRVGMVGLTCREQDIVQVDLSRPLTGGFALAETQLFGLLPLATSVRIVDSPNFTFFLKGVSNSPFLQSLEIANCDLRGELPAEIGECTQLRTLDISHSKLGGELPVELGELTFLETLKIEYSSITGIGLPYYGNLNVLKRLLLVGLPASGTLPEAIGDMDSLEELRISRTFLRDPLPASYRQLSNLRILDLSSNRIQQLHAGLFSGAPGSLQGSLQYLLLDDNDQGGGFRRLPNLTGYSALRSVSLSRCGLQRTAAGTLGFYLGETGARLLVVDASDNLFSSLLTFVANPFYGACNFTNNRLCFDSVIDSFYFTANCTLGLRPRDCPVCGDTSCYDCLGTPGGSAVNDVCGVCAGSGNSCFDCNNVAGGTSRLDACGICDGNNSTCLDCAGVPLGSAVDDGCGVCNGPAACADCAGVPNGLSVYDVCGVCNGRGNSCRDCSGTLNGTAKFDECGVCMGDGSTCASAQALAYYKNGGAFGLFIFLAILLALLVLVAGVFIYLLFNY